MTKDKEKEEKKKNRRLSSDGKRAAHVKWDGKTIALGTFPDAEAELACKRAKSLTRSWRAMFPKPTVEEVKRSLEKIGIRVVNDRPGRQPRDKSKDNDKVGNTISTTQTPADTMKMQGDPISTNTSASGQQLQENLYKSSDYFLPLTQTAPPVGQGRAVDAQFPSSKQQADLPIGSISNHNQKQEPGSESDSDDDGDLDETYETLERHHSNLADEIVEIRALMEFYGEKRERRRMRRKRLAQQEQRNQRSMMKRRRGVGPEPLDLSLASGLGKGGLGSGLSDTGGLGSGLSSTEGLGSGSSDTGGLGNVLSDTGGLGSGLSGTTGGLGSELSSTGAGGLGNGLSGTGGLRNRFSGTGKLSGIGGMGRANGARIDMNQISVEGSPVSQATMTTSNVRNDNYPNMSTCIDESIKGKTGLMANVGQMTETDTSYSNMGTKKNRQQQMLPPLSMNIAYTPENTQQGDMPPPQSQNTRFAVDNLPEDWRC